MGQKVNPIAARLPLTRNWLSRWYTSNSKKYKDQLLEDVKIRQLITKKLKAAGISKVIVERSAGKLKITVWVSRPGMGIGRGGTGVEELRKAVEKEINQKGSLNV